MQRPCLTATLTLIALGCLLLPACKVQPGAWPKPGLPAGSSRTEPSVEAQASPIQASVSFDGGYNIVELTVDPDYANPDWHYRWEATGALGLGSLSITPGAEPERRLRTALAVFDRPGAYLVELAAFDAAETQVASATYTLRLEKGYRYPGVEQRVPYRTLSSIGQSLAIEGRITTVKGGSPADFPIVGHAGHFTIYQPRTGGYFGLKTDTGAWCNLFVSPLPSYHIDRPDRDWYLTQWNTETVSNCGPTATAMAINWAKGIRISVNDIRRMVGWEGNGAVSLDRLKEVCDREGVKARILPLSSPDDIFKLLQRNELVILSYNMAGITTSQNPQTDLFGQHYVDHGGHYLCLKGFSLDRRYLIVYDPIPSDWGFNRLRYADGVSMIGRNRYFPVAELWPALSARMALAVSGG